MIPTLTFGRHYYWALGARVFAVTLVKPDGFNVSLDLYLGPWFLEIGCRFVKKRP